MTNERATDLPAGKIIPTSAGFIEIVVSRSSWLTVVRYGQDGWRAGLNTAVTWSELGNEVRKLGIGESEAEELVRRFRSEWSALGGAIIEAPKDRLTLGEKLATPLVALVLAPARLPLFFLFVVLATIGVVCLLSWVAR